MTTSHKVIVTVLYPRREMSSFDMEYYLNHHIPTTNAAWVGYGMTSCTVCEVDKDSEFAIQVTMTWKDKDGWNDAQKAESTKKITADIENFTNVRPITVIGTVV